MTPSTKAEAKTDLLQRQVMVKDDEIQRLRNVLRAIRFATYSRDTDDAVLYEIGNILTRAGFPYTPED